MMNNSQSERDTTHARYECICGSYITVRPSDFNHLRWATHKFGFTNPSLFINHQQDCCDRPRYMEVNGYSETELHDPNDKDHETKQPNDNFDVSSLGNLDELEQTIRNTLSTWVDKNDHHSAEITSIHVNGSFGAKCAHKDSDLDITIGLTSITRLDGHKASEYLQENLPTHDGWWKIDPCVLPTGKDVHAHLEESSIHAGHSTVYDLNKREYIDVDSLR